MLHCVQQLPIDFVFECNKSQYTITEADRWTRFVPQDDEVVRVEMSVHCWHAPRDGTQGEVANNGHRRRGRPLSEPCSVHPGVVVVVVAAAAQSVTEEERIRVGFLFLYDK